MLNITAVALGFLVILSEFFCFLYDFSIHKSCPLLALFPPPFSPCFNHILMHPLPYTFLLCSFSHRVCYCDPFRTHTAVETLFHQGMSWDYWLFKTTRGKMTCSSCFQFIMDCAIQTHGSQLELCPTESISDDADRKQLDPLMKGTPWVDSSTNRNKDSVFLYPCLCA